MIKINDTDLDTKWTRLKYIDLQIGQISFFLDLVLCQHIGSLGLVQ